jgi:hypothetical protein
MDFNNLGTQVRRHVHVAPKLWAQVVRSGVKLNKSRDLGYLKQRTPKLAVL